MVEAIIFKRCPRCQSEKPTTDFHRNVSKRDGCSTHCKSCVNEWNRSDRGKASTQRYKKTEKSKQAIERYRRTSKYVALVRRRNLRKRFGITAADYDEMLRRQNGQCAICGGTNPRNKGGKYFAVDHCHKTGLVRGLLCGRCNVALAVFGDDLKGIMRVVKYLRGHINRRSCDIARSSQIS